MSGVIRAAEPAKPWVCYIRVSTEDQARHGVSLDAQRAGCVALCQAYGHQLLDVIVDDGYSAKDLKRPGMRRLIDLVEKRAIRGVIIWKLDRLFRNTLDCLHQVERMKEAGVELASVNERIDTSSAMGQCFLTLNAAFGQLERQQISERVSAAFKHMRTTGRSIGGFTPSGLRAEPGTDGHKYMKVCERTGPLVRDCWRRIVAGASVRQVAAYLTEAGVPTRTGKPWSAAAVSHLLKVQAYIGLLIDQQTYDAARDALSNRSNPMAQRPGTQHAARAPKLTTNRAWRLQGLVYCARCGSAINGVTARGKLGVEYAYLRCTGRVRLGKTFCTSGDLPAQAWENVVVERLVEYLLESDDLGRHIATLAAKHQAEAGAVRDQREAAQVKRDGLARQLEAAMDAALAGGAVARAYASRIAALQEQIETLDVELAATAGSLAAADLSIDRIRTIAETIREEARDMATWSWEEQRTHLRNLVERVEIASGMEGRIVLRMKTVLSVSPSTGFVQAVKSGRPGRTSNEPVTGIPIPLRVQEKRGRDGRREVMLATP